MDHINATRKLICEHFASYPKLQLADIFKFLHQSAFGCEHMVNSYEDALARIEAELETALISDSGAFCEALDGDYSRAHLSWIKKGLSPKTLARLFFLSAKAEAEGALRLEAKLTIAAELISEGRLPFSYSEFAAAADKWKRDGFPPLHHSESFRDEYRPAYRVIWNGYVPYLPLFAEIDKRLAEGSLTLAIEGGSASGKSTLGAMLKDIYGCTLFHMDDFFLRPEQRTPERFAEPGGNVDRERFLDQVLLPLSENKDVVYQKYDCGTCSLLPPEKISPTPLTVIEGAYSMHPDLADHYGFSVFLDISPELQRKRISKRNSPPLAKRFFEEWIPLEVKYFDALRVKERCDMILPIKE